MRRVVLGVVLSLSSLACHHSHVSGTASTDAVLDAFKDAGLDVAAMKVVEPDAWAADHCSSGSIENLDVLICEYQTEQAEAQGEKEVWRDWDTANVDTAVALRNGHTMLAIADRRKRDVGGRATARMLNAFRALP